MESALKGVKNIVATGLNIPYLYSKYSYSQEGEDIIISKLFNNKKRGYYVDVGAHHPFRYSNTYLLYRNGWSGINIDPTMGTKLLFDKTRKRDINIEVGIAKNTTKKKLYVFENQALNTFSKKRAKVVTSNNQSRLINELIVNTNTLSNILDKYLSKNIKVDFLNIDVEGCENEVLESNNWEKHSPKIICIENLGKTTIEKYLIKKGYRKIAQTISSQIYIHEK